MKQLCNILSEQHLNCSVLKLALRILELMLAGVLSAIGTWYSCCV